ncbi:MAG: methyltransferase domain-containing protein [Deltaproteobacteria bacterium]|nr:methyltransferase domain-containing protein [Deltaproteobacteria bacterium]
MIYKIKNKITKMLSDFYLGLFGYPSADFSVDYNKYGLKKFPQDPHNISVFRKKRAELVNSLISPNSTVLDLGCGDGAILIYIDDHNLIDGTGVDITEQSKVALGDHDLKFIKADISDLKNTTLIPAADHVLLLELIEHFSNPEALLSAYLAKANKGVIFSVPNTGFVLHRLRLLFGRFPLQWQLYPGEHLRFWTIKDMHWWLKKQGFQNAQCHYYRGVPVLNNLWPNLFAAGIIVQIPSEK